MHEKINLLLFQFDKTGLDKKLKALGYTGSSSVDTYTEKIAKRRAQAFNIELLKD
ncbi:hypothetical protein [Endozoicomonas sp. ALC020]|uniref:hypothetical protein n=1 Tax=unclassified Endozoicomonas TaxID=2644528 RepID=UPI003BAEC012